MAASKPVKPLIKPSDATAWISCIRRVWLDKHHTAEFEIDEFNQLLIDKGLEHETAVLAKLQEQYHSIQKADSFEHTRILMQQGIPVIYQGRLSDEQKEIVGYPDFLIRHDSGQYQPADAKLSQSENKKGLQIQLGLYRQLLATQLPAIVFLGDGRTALLGDEVNPLVDEFIASMKAILTMPEQPPVRYSHSRCRVCSYYTHCRSDFDRKEDISLLYGIHGIAASQLATAGISTISQLAASTVESIPDVPHLKGSKRKQRAILQAQSSQTGKIFQTSKMTLPEGTWIHFDIEDNPLTPNRARHVYLWGLLAPPYTQTAFDYVWTDTEDQDYTGWLAFLQKIDTYRDQYPRLILAHYSNHEKATIRKYAERYAMENHATVLWLLSDDSPLFDLQKPILDCLILPLQGYGLKDICKHPDLVNFQWENEESGSQWSVVQFHRFLAAPTPVEKQRLKTEILGYNRDDVTATRRLEVWLRDKFL